MFVLLSIVVLVTSVIGARDLLLFEDFQAPYATLPNISNFELNPLELTALLDFNIDLSSFFVPEIESPCFQDQVSFFEEVLPCDPPAPPPPAPGAIFPFPQPSPVSPDVIQEFDENRQKWEDSNVEYYSFTISRSCFCLYESVQPVDVSVCQGEATEPEFYADINTFEKVFDFVAVVLAEPLETVTITYDPIYGFITDFFVDKNLGIADEEIGYSISNFQELSIDTCFV